MSTPTGSDRRRQHFLQRRTNIAFDQLRPGRWSWSTIIAPLDERVLHGREEALSPRAIWNLRYFSVGTAANPVQMGYSCARVNATQTWSNH